MEFMEVVKTRKSIRTFLPQEVDKEILKQIMEVAVKPHRGAIASHGKFMWQPERHWKE